MKSRVTIFADDLKLIGNASDRTIIDKDLENLGPRIVGKEMAFKV